MVLFYRDYVYQFMRIVSYTCSA